MDNCTPLEIFPSNLIANCTQDTYGRRSLLLFTFPNMAWSLLVVGLCSLIASGSSDSKLRLGLMAFFIYVFAMFYSPGEGPVPYAYSAEVFPLSHREVGMGFAVATCLFWAAVLGITLPRMIHVFGIVGAFGFYAGLNVLAFIMIFLFVPETKQRTLEELDYVFAVHVRKHMRYQVFTALPWWFRRYILRKKVQLEPLYRFDLMPGGSDGRRREIDELMRNEKVMVEMREGRTDGAGMLPPEVRESVRRGPRNGAGISY